MRKRTEHGLKADLSAEALTKAEKRAIKKRPRMKVHGASLRRASKYAGLKLAKAKP